ncbi:MAG: polysaccharide deacetylase family protein [Oceanihabitans sp.]
MNLIPVKIPLVLKKMFPNYIWNIPTKQKVIYLTFDDGPTPEITNWVLDLLKQYNAKATFFCIGNNVAKHPEVFQDILKEGHIIGNHTYNHVKGWQTKTDAYVENVQLAAEVIESQIKKSTFKNRLSKTSNSESSISNLFRPPYGQISPKQGKSLIKLGYKIIMWEVLSIDWELTVTPEKCLKNVITKAQPGSVVVFHDSVKASKNLKYALPKVLAHFSDLGYVFHGIS